MCTQEEETSDIRKIPENDLNVAFMALEARHFHIYEMLRLLWGSYVCDKYISSLFVDTRNNTRKGFEPYIIEALVIVQDSHSSAYRDKVMKFNYNFTGH